MTSLSTTVSAPRARHTPRGAPAALWLGLLIGAGALSQVPEAFNRPLLRLIDAAPRHPVVDAVCVNLANTNTLTGAVFLAAIWCCWFGGTEQERTRLLAGTVAGFAASALARTLGVLLPFRARPMHDPLLDLHLSPLMDRSSLAGWNSFPSDNAALWFALAGTAALVRPRLGLPALGWAALACLSRSYLGYHYPTDIVGGAALGLLLVAASGYGPARSLAETLVAAAERRPSAFYCAAFLASFLIATQTDGLRRLTTDLAAAMHVHPG